jgi:hypothetical protein
VTVLAATIAHVATAAATIVTAATATTIVTRNNFLSLALG